MKSIIYSAFIALALTSCQNNTIYDQNIAIQGRSWTYEQKPKFDVHIKDSTQKYNLYINLRHTSDYDYSNIYVLLHEKGSKIIDSTYRKEMKLAELDGRWLGKYAASLYEVSYPLKENYTFPDTGIYTFIVEQNMRDNPLKDISDIGIKVVKQ